MKKLFLICTIVAVALFAFSFTPAEKSTALNNEIVSDFDEALLGSCDTRFARDTTFRKCDTVWTEGTLEQIALQTSVLQEL